MKPSEESRYTAWIDGSLAPEEAAQFEKDLADQGVPLSEALREKQGAQQLGALLRTHLKAPPLRNADFFTQEIMRQIEEESPRTAHSFAVEQATPTRGAFLRLFLFTTYCSIAAFFLYATLSSEVKEQPAPYYAEFFDTEAGDLGISAVPLHTGEESLTVLWLDGLDYLAYVEERAPQGSRRGGRP